MSQDYLDSNSYYNGNRNDNFRGDNSGHNRDLMANIMQVAMINKMLPKGYKFELYDTVKRQHDNLQQVRTVPAPSKRRKVSIKI